MQNWQSLFLVLVVTRLESLDLHKTGGEIAVRFRKVAEGGAGGRVYGAKYFVSH